MKKITLYYTDSYDGKSSHDLLFSAASMYAGIEANDFILHCEQGKKPYFYNCQSIHFSISHSKNIWLCAFAEDEVGVDIQLIAGSRHWIKLAERFFSTDEVENVKSTDDTVAVFNSIWSRKEAVVKLFGIGIDGRFSSFSTLGDSIKFMDKDVIIRDFRLDITEVYSASVAYCDDFELEIHKLT